MTDQLVTFFKDEVSAYSLVFKHTKGLYRLFKRAAWITTVLMLMLPISLIVFFPAMNLTKTQLVIGSAIVLYGLLLASALSLFISYKLLNSKARVVLRKKYKKRASKGIWHSTDFKRHQNELLIEFLIKNGAYEPKKLELLIQMLEKETNQKKQSAFLSPGMIVALLLPNLVLLLTVMYQDIDITTAIEIFTLTTIFIVLSVFLIAFIKHIHKEFLELVFTNEVTLRKAAIGRLEDILIRYPHEEKQDGNVPDSSVSIL